MVTLTQAHVIRATAATTVGVASAWIEADADNVLYAAIRANTIGDKNTLAIGYSFFLGQACTFEGLTEDRSTGGTCDYFLAAHMTLYTSYIT